MQKQDSDSYVSGLRNQEDMMDSPTGNGINHPRNNRLDNSAQYSGDLNRSINQLNAFEQTYEDLLPKLKNDIPGVIFVDNYMFPNGSMYKGQMLIEKNGSGLEER